MKLISEQNIFSILRVALSLIFLWAFFDKLFGLGFATLPEKSWVSGSSPTAGFLTFGVDGFFSSIFHALSGNVLVDILFMGGLLLVGLCLMLGVGTKIACYSGALMMTLIYLSLFPLKNNPLVDEHIIYILVLLLLSQKPNAPHLPLNHWWKRTSLVRKHPILE